MSVTNTDYFAALLWFAEFTGGRLKRDLRRMGFLKEERPLTLVGAILRPILAEDAMDDEDDSNYLFEATYAVDGIGTTATKITLDLDATTHEEARAWLVSAHQEALAEGGE